MKFLTRYPESKLQQWWRIARGGEQSFHGFTSSTGNPEKIDVKIGNRSRNGKKVKRGKVSNEKQDEQVSREWLINNVVEKETVYIRDIFIRLNERESLQKML